MTTDVLRLAADEREAADAAYRATLRMARRLTAGADRPCEPHTAAADADGAVVVLAHGPADGRCPGRDPAALAGLLVRARALADGTTVVLATGTGDEFAARLAAALAALGREATCTSRAADFAFGVRVAAPVQRARAVAWPRVRAPVECTAERAPDARPGRSRTRIIRG